VKKKAKGSKAPPRRARTDVEVEVKLRCDDIACLTEAGLDLEAVHERHFEDNWVYELPDGKLRKGQYLRIRYTGNGDSTVRARHGHGVLTYKGKARADGASQKGKNKGKKVREEIETTIGRPTKMVKILNRLGLRRSFRYQKYRSVYRVTLDDNRKLLAMFDETPIGNFLELEGDAEVIELVASRIGFKPDAYVADSYVEMQLARCIARGEPLTDMVFPPTKAVRRGKKKKK